ncbi:MAG: type II toxin-antitoxin system PemK/MazF family toxin [Planctomycetes bacterium]|nr:type II toxin-antitoxin system PemK/MazF family toxin [Planctomycetota bacterium]
MTIRPGELWVDDIPFTDGSGSKRRPVLVLWIDAADVVAAVVTTAVPRSSTDVPLTAWQASGLRAASTVRLSRLDCLQQSLLIARIGTISPADAQTITQVWANVVKPDF